MFGLFGMPQTPNQNQELYKMLGVNPGRAQTRGMLTAASALMNAGAGGPTPAHASLGRALGQAGLMGMSAYDTEMQNAMARNLSVMKLKDMKREQDLATKLGVPRSALPGYYTAAFASKFPKNKYVPITETNYKKFGISTAAFDQAQSQGKHFQGDLRTGKISTLGSGQNFIFPPGEKEFEKRVGGNFGNAYTEILKQGSQAGATLDAWRTAYHALPSNQGPGRDIQNYADVAKTAVLEFIGVKPSAETRSRLASFQQFKAMAMENLLKELAKQKGPQTEPDARRGEKVFLQTTNIKEANDFLYRWKTNVLKRTITQGEFIKKYMRNAPGKRSRQEMFEDAQSAWGDHLRKTPLIHRRKAADGSFTGDAIFLEEYDDTYRTNLPQGQVYNRQTMLNNWRQYIKTNNRLGG